MAKQLLMAYGELRILKALWRTYGVLVRIYAAPLRTFDTLLVARQILMAYGKLLRIERVGLQTCVALLRRNSSMAK